MKNLMRFLLLLAVLTGVQAFGQVTSTCNYGPCPLITASGGTLTVANIYGGMNATFEEIVSGAPATVSITVQGCMRGGTCDTAMDTNTTVGSSNRSVVPTTKPYSYFLITATWTGGTNPTVQINPYITSARGGSAGAGSGTVTSFSAGNLSPLFTTSVATGTTTPALSFALSNAAANTILGNFTGGSTAPSYTAVGTGIPTFLITPSSANLFSALTTKTGSGGSSVFATGPTLSSPLITTILDGNGNPFLTSSATASAVDGVTVTNAATANPATVVITATGTDTNINLNLVSKGTGTVTCNGVACSGTVSNCATVGANAYYAATGTVVTCDASAVFSGAGALTLGGVGLGTATITLNGNTSGSASITTGASGGNVQLSGTNVGDTAGYNISQTTASSGSGGVRFGVTGSGTTEAADITGGVSTGLLNSNNRCNVNTAISLSGATTICSWTLPNVAKIWGWQCGLNWNLTTLGTTPTLSLGMNAAQAPTSPGEVGSANIFTTNTGTSTQANAVAFTTTGNNSILTSASPAGTGSYRVEENGTINASATSGTFLLTATLAGTGSVATVSGTCVLY